MCLVLIAQMCTKCGFCMLGADNSDVYKSEDVNTQLLA